MIGKLRNHLGLIVVALWAAYFTVHDGGPKMLPRLVMIVFLVLAVLAWKPLHKRFRAWAILFSYFYVGLPLILLSDPSASSSDLLRVLSLTFAISAIVLLFNRQKPIELRMPNLASMIINGHWDLLAKEGVPADEIERLKRLTREERVALWAALSKGLNKRERLHDPFGEKSKFFIDNISDPYDPSLILDHHDS